MLHATLHTDGGSKGNPGPAGIGFVLDLDDGRQFHGGSYIGETSNNIAEYTALAWGLDNALAAGVDEISARADSELMVNQINGTYRIKNEGLKPIFQQVIVRLGRFAKNEVEYIRHEDNKLADDLVDEALEAHATVGDFLRRPETQQSLFDLTSADALVPKPVLPSRVMEEYRAVRAREAARAQTPFDENADDGISSCDGIPSGGLDDVMIPEGLAPVGRNGDAGTVVSAAASDMVPRAGSGDGEHSMAALTLDDAMERVESCGDPGTDAVPAHDTVFGIPEVPRSQLELARVSGLQGQFVLSVSSGFTAMRLVGDSGSTVPHPQRGTWDVTVSMSKHSIGGDGMVYDAVQLKSDLDTVIDGMEGRLLDDLPVFRTDNPTMENIARTICHTLNVLAPTGYAITSVTVSDKSFASVTFSPTM